MNSWVYALQLSSIIQTIQGQGSSPPQYTQLYHSNMGFGTGWEVEGLPFSSNDPQYCAVDDCVYLTNSASIIQRGIGTFRFHTIKVQYSMSPWDLQSVTNDRCDVFYSINNGQEWKLLREFDHTSTKGNWINTLDKDADSLATGISIKFQALSDGTSDHRCYVDEVYVFGIYGSRQPTNHPTMDPTLSPSVSPTNPTFVPSGTPSAAPTQSTAAPSQVPSATPSNLPTSAPTPAPVTPWGVIIPSASTTTVAPSVTASVTSSVLTSNNASSTANPDLVQQISSTNIDQDPNIDTITGNYDQPGPGDNNGNLGDNRLPDIQNQTPLDQDTDNADEGDAVNSNLPNSNSEIRTASSSNYALWVLILAIIFGIIIIISWIYGTKLGKYKNDFYRLTALVVVSMYILDEFAYILFIFNLVHQPEFMSSVLLQVLLVSAAIFIILPVCITLIQLKIQIKKWEKHSIEFTEWISTNASFLMFISIITLSPFTSVKLCTTHLFNLNQFSMPISQLQCSSFQVQRLFSTILSQSIPQMVIEILFIFHARGKPVYDNIMYVAVTLTLLSVFMGIYEITKTKHRSRAEDFVSIEFDVTGIVNARKHRNRVKEIRDRMSSLIGVNINNLEVVRPSHIPKGLRVVINVGINHDPKKIAKNIGILINEAHENGELNEIIEKAWNLSQAPDIDNVAVI